MIEITKWQSNKELLCNGRRYSVKLIWLSTKLLHQFTRRFFANSCCLQILYQSEEKGLISSGPKSRVIASFTNPNFLTVFYSYLSRRGNLTFPLTLLWHCKQYPLSERSTRDSTVKCNRLETRAPLTKSSEHEH